MSKLTQTHFYFWIKRILMVGLLSVFIALVYLVLHPFFASIIWAFVLAHITWPLREKLNNAIRHRPTLCALLMTTGTALLILLPLFWFVLMIQDNLVDAFYSLEKYLASGKNWLPDAIVKIPWLGEQLQHWTKDHLSDPATFHQQLSLLAKQESAQIVQFFGNVSRNVAKAIFTTIILFVFYRDGEKIVRNIKTALYRLIGERSEVYFQVIGITVRAVMFGVILIAIAQGIVAAIGFSIFGVTDVVLLGTLTAIASIIPIVGTFLIWGPVSFGLFIHGHVWEAVGLFAWGSLLISTVDNLIRPLVISQAMQVSFLLVMFGIFGGIAAFGLFGLFVGPIVLMIAMTVWDEWVDGSTKNRQT